MKKEQEKKLDKAELEKMLRGFGKHFYKTGFNDGFLVGVILSFIGSMIAILVLWLFIK